jgi:peptidoglycan/xylan/chitin deacetylase (PgdA/CDA1 family)
MNPSEFFSRRFGVRFSKKARLFMRKAVVVFFIPFFLQAGCGRKSILQPPGHVETVAIEKGYVSSVTLCRWSHDKKAAYTIAFDDSRRSHYEIAGPELKKRGIVGTFNLNTKAVAAWRPWQELFDCGNEIASHTWSHPNCTKISESDFRTEIRKAIEDIHNHIKGITEIPSFTFPYGVSNEAVRRIVLETHLSARSTNTGLNPGSFRDEGFSGVSGIGAYPPYSVDSLNCAVEKAIRENAWLLVYFHSIGERGGSGPNTVPLKEFRKHLDFVLARKGDLWIATQGQAASYIWMRQKASASCVQLNPDTLEVRLEGAVTERAFPVRLSVKLTLPSDWCGHVLVVENSQGGKERIAASSEPDVVLNMPVRSTSLVYAVQ